MKVKCIGHRNLWFEYDRHILWFKLKDRPCIGPGYNEVVTVIKEYYEDGIKLYDLVEWPKGPWQAKWFVPIEQKYEKVTAHEIREGASAN